MSPNINTVFEAAIQAHAAGLCIMPPAEDGSKRPLPDSEGNWKTYQRRCSTPDDLRRWYPGCSGLGVVTGKVSGYVEVWDFDDPATYQAFVAAARACGLGEVVDRIEVGYRDDTPGGGSRWLAHYPAEVKRRPGDRHVLARRPKRPGERRHAKDKIKVLIELPAFAIVAPTNGKVHPTGKPYVRRSGSFETIAAYTAEERDALIELARSFDETPRTHAEPRAQRKSARNGEVRPGDDYAARTTWEELLGPAGWRRVYRRGDVTYWCRPGKKFGVSATTNHAGLDLLHVFSSSTEFEPDKSYSKFAAYTVLKHDGDFNAAARDLARQGYGQPGGAGDHQPWRKKKPETNGSAKKDYTDEESVRPNIQIKAGDLSLMATMAEKHLINSGAPFYRRGSMLVRPLVIEVPASDNRKTKIAALEEVSEVYMRDMLSRQIFWQKIQHRGAGETVAAADPPMSVAKTILGRTGEWGFPPIVAVITTPTLRPDGTVLVEPGYDPTTQLMLIGPPSLPQMPEKPTYDEAYEALNVLDELLDDFPFVDDESRSTALSALITPVVRGAFAVAPMHAGRAPKAGSGKSYLLDTAAAIAIGEPCPAIAAGRDEAETEKRLVSVVLAGYPLINIDNVNGELAGDFLCQVIERPIVNPRVLGKSKTVRVPNRMTTFCNGNNLRLTGDMPRRALLCSLDAKTERPEEREFKSDPVERVLADRGKYIAAALTVVRAYIVAGRPGKLRPLASFKGWSDTVRSALVWLGRVDPVKTMATVRAEDPEEQALTALLIAWKDAFGTGFKNALTASEAIARAQERLNTGQPVYSSAGWAKPALRAAIESISPRGSPDAKSLGKWLASKKDRIASGLRFTQAMRSGCASDWYVEKV
jgi:putative DNA primase/helicase